MEIRGAEEGLASEHWEDKDYGVWHEFGPTEKSWKGSLRGLSDIELVAMQSFVVAAYVGYTRNAVAI